MYCNLLYQTPGLARTKRLLCDVSHTYTTPDSAHQSSKYSTDSKGGECELRQVQQVSRSVRSLLLYSDRSDWCVLLHCSEEQTPALSLSCCWLAGYLFERGCCSLCLPSAWC